MIDYSITLKIPAERIANMMISAIESGDPVTTAAKGAGVPTAIVPPPEQGVPQ